MLQTTLQTAEFNPADTADMADMADVADVADVADAIDDKNDFSIQTVLKNSGLDWEPKIVTSDAFPGWIGVAHPYTGKIFGVSKKSYRPLGNAEAFRWVSPLIKSGDLSLDRVFSSKFGDVVCISLLVNQGSYEVMPGDQYNTYLVVYNSHIPSKLGVGGRFITQRMVCMNQLHAIVYDKSGKSGKAHANFTYRHTTKLMDRMNVTRRQIAIQCKVSDNFASNLRLMAQTPMSLSLFRKYLETVWGDRVKSKRGNPRYIEDTRFYDILVNKFKNPEVPETAGTVYAGYQAFTSWLTHDHGKKENREILNLFGEGMRRSIAAYKLAVDLCNPT